MTKKYVIQLIILLFLGFNSCICKDNSSSIKTTNTYYKSQNDSCIIANEIRTTIIDFINNKNEEIYNEDFIASFLTINKYDWNCYFPKSPEDVRLYYFLGDSVIMKKIKHDERAMKLLIDLYLVNRNNAELSEYYGFGILPNAASENIISFIKAVTKLSEKDAEKCINKLKYINDKTKKEKIINEINRYDKQEYLIVINKIKAILQ